MTTTGTYQPGNYQPPEGPQRNWFLRHKILSAVLGVLALFVAIGVTGGGKPPSTTTAAAAASAATVTVTAAPTATLTAAVAAPSAEQAAIDRLHPGCTEDGAALGREAGKALELLQRGGVQDETELTVLVHLRDSLPPGVPDMNCAEILAAYVTLRTPH